MNQMNNAITDTKIQIESVYRAQIDAFGIFDFPFLINILNRHNVETVLDIGTGEGSFLIELAKNTNHIAFDAIDVNENLIEMAKAKCQKSKLDINFFQANFGTTILESTYDLIMARFAIEHIRNFVDIDAFLLSAHEKLNPNGWIVIIEYFISSLNIEDEIWKKFRKKEIATYKSAKAHAHIGLKLPESLSKANYKNISSMINHISPHTVGPDKFFALVLEYTKLYSQIAPPLWTKELVDQITFWCNKKQPKGDPAIFTSYTIGQK